jgi:hypothetical protein
MCTPSRLESCGFLHHVLTYRPNVSEDLLPYLHGRRFFCPEDGCAGSYDDLICIYQTTCCHLPED